LCHPRVRGDDDLRRGDERVRLRGTGATTAVRHR
jgi:hypothetical protein